MDFALNEDQVAIQDAARAFGVLRRPPPAGPDWSCTSCGESSGPQFTQCWSCGELRNFRG